MEFELFNDGWRGYTLGLGDLWESEFLLCAVGVCVCLLGVMLSFLLIVLVYSIAAYFSKCFLTCEI